MARPPKGKPLKFRPIRLDDEVWAECQRLGKEHGTINEGLRARLFEQLTMPPTNEPILEVVSREVRRYVQSRKRGPRAKGDKTR